MIHQTILIASSGTKLVQLTLIPEGVASYGQFYLGLRLPQQLTKAPDAQSGCLLRILVISFVKRGARDIHVRQH